MRRASYLPAAPASCISPPECDRGARDVAMMDDSNDGGPRALAATRVVLADVVLAFDGRAVLQGVTFSAEDRRVGIVGRNGSGKSTLARVIAGLIAPQAGTVRLNGHDPACDRRAALREVGILFQNPDHQIIFPTVIEEIAFGLTQMGRSRAEAAEAARAILVEFGVGHWHETQVASLSQGQKHLVCLMAVVAMQPGLVILDEPFAGLDIPTRAQLMRSLARYRGTLVHITHDPRDLAGYDRVIWIDRGAVRLDGPAAPVLEAYLAEMTRSGEADDLADLAG